MKKLGLAKRITYVAISIALSYALSFLEIPLFLGFLKLDFSFSVILLCSYILGAFDGEIVILGVSLLSLFKTTSFGLGELCNFILANVFIILPTVIYKYKKGLKAVIITLISASVLATALSLPLNRFVIFPIYADMGFIDLELFYTAFWFIILFNVIKYFSNAIITILLYKRVSNILIKI